MNNREEFSQNDESGYWISISDLMSCLLIIFILTLCYYMLSYTEKTTRLTDNFRVRQEILIEIKNTLEKRANLSIEVDAEHGVLRLPEGVLFDSGEAVVKDDGERVLEILGGVLFQVLDREKYRGRVETIFIEGHTDSRPIHNAQFDSNWELSTKRAINSWQELTLHEPQLNMLANIRGEPLFSCSGYAESRPISEELDEDGFRRNRRIDLRFSMTPPKPEEPEIVGDVRGRLPVSIQ